MAPSTEEPTLDVVSTSEAPLQGTKPKYIPPCFLDKHNIFVWFRDLQNVTNIQSFLETENNCKNCNARIMLLGSFPCSLYSQIKGVEAYKIHSKDALRAMQVKQNFLYNYYRVRVTYDYLSQSMQIPWDSPTANLFYKGIENLLKKFPFYTLFKVQETPEEDTLSFYDSSLYAKKTSEGPLWNKLMTDVQTFVTYLSKLKPEGRPIEETSTMEHLKMDLSTVKPFESSLSNLSATDSYTIDFNNIRLPSWSKYLFLDIDGTSTLKELRQKKSVSNKLNFFFHRLLVLLEKEGVLKTIITTGRPWQWATIYGSDIGITAPYICSGGYACVYPRTSDYCIKDSMYVQINDLSQFTDKIMEIIKWKYDIHCSSWMNNTGMTVLKFLDRDTIPESLQEIINADRQIGKLKLRYGIPKDARIILEMDQSCKVILKHSLWNKGEAVKVLCKMLDVKKEDTISIGNHFNDVSLTSVVGHSISVKNGHPDYTKNCSTIAAANESKGAYGSLKDYLTDATKMGSKVISEEQWAGYVQSVKKQILEETLYTLE